MKLLPVDLPFRKIDHLPGINNILPVRLSLYVVFFVAVLVAIGIDVFRDDVFVEPGATGRNKASAPLACRTWRPASPAGVIVLAGVVALLPRWPYRRFPARVNPG